MLVMLVHTAVLSVERSSEATLGQYENMPSMLVQAEVSRFVRSMLRHVSSSENHQAHETGFTASSKRTDVTLRADSCQGARSV